MMGCLYCNGEVQEVISYPYPYLRVAVNDRAKGSVTKKEEVQFIKKFVCKECGYPSFNESRLGYDGKWIYQEYKQGLYILYPNMR